MMFIAFDRIIPAAAPANARMVLWVCPSDTFVVLLDVSDDGSWPEVVPMEEALANARSGAWAIETGEPPRVQLDREAEPAHIEKRDADYAIIRAMVEESVPDVFFKMRRSKLVAEAAAEAHTTTVTVKKHVQRYFHAGMSSAGLIPHYMNSGAPGRARKPGEAKLGRPVRDGHPPGLNIDAELRRLFRLAISVSYARNRRHDLVSAYHFCVRKFLSLEIRHPDGRIEFVARPEYRATGLPRQEQFNYWFRRDHDVVDVARRRQTERVYDMATKPLLGTSTAEAPGPCSRFQIDATVLDLYVRSRRDRRQLIGRPVLYVVIDVFSHLIVGMYVGLESPSLVAAMMALANAASDKVAYCRSFGREISETEWPARHICGQLLGDRGEIESAGIDGILKTFRINIENARAYRADWKGLVESRFKLLPAIFRPYAPGYVETDFRERGADDYRADAVLDIDDVTKILIDIVLYYNNFHVIVGYPRQSGMGEDDVPSIPLELWNWGIANRSGIPRAPQIERLRFALMPEDDATVTPQGILYQGRYYTAQKALRENWYSKARVKRFKVRISFDKRDVDRIYVHDRTAPYGFDVGLLNDHSMEHAGLTGWESHALQTAADRLHASRRDAQVLARAQAEARIEEVVDAAKADLAALPPGGSHRAQVASLRSARAEELAHDRVGEAAAYRPIAAGGDGPGASAEVLSFTPRARADAAAKPSMRDILDAQEGDDDQ